MKLKNWILKTVVSLLKSAPSGGIPSSVERVTFNKAGAPDLQQAKPLSKQPMCNHMGDTDSCEGGDAGAVKSDFFNRTRYEQKRFLVLSTTGLGDTLWGTPALRALRETDPNCYIALLTSPIGKEILKYNSHIDEIFVIKDPVFFRLFSLFRTLRKRKISHVLSFHVSQRPILPLAAVLGAQKIIGTKGLHKDLDFLLTDALEKKQHHEIQRRLDIAAHVGAYTNDTSLELPVSPQEEAAVNALLKQWNIPPHLPLIALHPGAKDLFKQWPPEHFVLLGKKLAQNLGCRIFITGTPSEEKCVTEIASQIEGAIPVIDLSLRKMAVLLKHMRLVIANDTGPMHVAFAMKTPTVALFVPTDPALCGPYLISKNHVIAKPPSCMPCLKKKCQSPFCLLQIGVDEVYDAATQLFYAYAP